MSNSISSSGSTFLPPLSSKSTEYTNKSVPTSVQSLGSNGQYGKVMPNVGVDAELQLSYINKNSSSSSYAQSPYYSQEVIPNPDNGLGRFVTIADTNNNNAISRKELEIAEPIIDMNNDFMITEGELETVSYIAAKDGKNGLSHKEMNVLNILNDILYKTNIPLNQDNVEQAIKPFIDFLYLQENNLTPPVPDLNGNHKIENFENHLAKLGISTDEHKRNLFTMLADANANGLISESEYHKVANYLNINLSDDGKVDKGELEFLGYVAALDGKRGLNTREEEILKKAQYLGYNYKKQTGQVADFNDPKFLQQGKHWAYNEYNAHNPDPNKIMLDLNKNGKIDEFERVASIKGINKNTTNDSQMIKIADANGDKKVSQAEFTAIQDILDVNSSGKADKNELALLEYITQLNGQNGFQYPEQIIASTIKHFLRAEKDATGEVFSIDDTALKKLQFGSKGMYDTLTSLSSGQVDLDALWKGQVEGPQLRGTGYRPVSQQELDSVIDQKTPLAHIDLNYNFGTGPDDYTKKIILAIRERIASGEMTEAMGKQRYIDIITAFRNSGHQFSQHEVTPW